MASVFQSTKNKTISTALSPLTPLFRENVMHLLCLFFANSVVYYDLNIFCFSQWRQYFNRQKIDASNKTLDDEIIHTTEDIQVNVSQLFRFANCVDILLMIIGLFFMLGDITCALANVILFGRITGLFATILFAVDCDIQYENSVSTIINNTVCPLGIDLNPLNYDRLYKLCHYHNKTISTTLPPLKPLFRENVMSLVYLFFGKSIEYDDSN
ncbi:unnamed protein product [Adineta steineri]|uniref:Uncharacterized protein n=2 Tax=Adineta steineri TaxID=433720 RepID=A0A814BCE5_9BILA|nr:unnamed protein product [Adineta steineri]